MPRQPFFPPPCDNKALQAYKPQDRVMLKGHRWQFANYYCPSKLMLCHLGSRTRQRSLNDHLRRLTPNYDSKKKLLDLALQSQADLSSLERYLSLSHLRPLILGQKSTVSKANVESCMGHYSHDFSSHQVCCRCHTG